MSDREKAEILRELERAMKEAHTWGKMSDGDPPAKLMPCRRKRARLI